MTEHKFKVGDKVVCQVGNISREGVIIDDPATATFWRNKNREWHCTLAFYGENEYFAWLDSYEKYIKPLTP